MEDFEARFGAIQEEPTKSGEARAAARRRAASDRRVAAMQARPDRIALWAFVMAIAVTLAAAASSKAASGGVSSEPEPSMSEAIATYYGPGFWGNRTACGQKLKRKTVGVAHKRLPCGTRVAIAYKGKRVTTKVIDRGPYANNAKWDLTMRLAKRLEFTHTDVVSAAVLD